jgi:hypothetical protein
VLYVHLTIPFEIGRARYDARRATSRESDALMTFDEAKKSPTERHAETLIEMADLVLDTAELGAETAANKVVARMQQVPGLCA